MSPHDAVVLVPPARPFPQGEPPARYARALTAAIHARQAQFAVALERLAGRAPILAEAAACLTGALRAGRKVLAAGNGGSATEAQHFVAELVGRFRRERDPYAVIALTADSAILTAVANDYGYAEVFARQVRALGSRGDVLVLFSTSGESENLLRAAVAARGAGVAVVAIVGERPGRLAHLADLAVPVPATETALIQELHQIVTHLLCEVIEAELSAGTTRVASVPVELPAATAFAPEAE